MSFIQPSIEGPPSSVQDPCNWTVDQVVVALTDKNSQLLKTNTQLSLPDPSILAKVLRENDVTGHALLTLVTDGHIRDELGIKSLSHRAAIIDLIEQLQDISSKFQERARRSARLTSVSLGSRVGSPYFATPSFEPRAVSMAVGSMISPISSSSQRGDQGGLSHHSVQLRNIFEEGPKIQELNRPTKDTVRTSEDMQSEEGSGINVTERISDKVEPEQIGNFPGAIATHHEERSPTNTKSVADDAERVERCDHQNETIVDETGKKRRRLVIAKPSTSVLTQGVQANVASFDGLLSSPETLRKDTNANTTFESNLSLISEGPIFEEEDLPATQELPGPVQARAPMSESALPSIEMVAEPGTVSIDENGRKRMRPIMLHEVDLDSEDPQTLKPISKTSNDTFGSSAPDLQVLEHAHLVQQRSYGKKAKRRGDQIYLGLESMPIDKLIYGDAALGEDLGKGQTARSMPQSAQSHEPNEFNIVPNIEIGIGQRLYVNARMKYLFQDHRISLKQDESDSIGLVPYPDWISRKNCPLSITLFARSSQGVTASRANRSKWSYVNRVSKVEEADGRTGNVFNVADPALARDESEDPEWRALEKWNFVEGENKVLPVYGDSGSEGEYDLETWREMEKERGKIARPLGRSHSAKLTSAEVRGAINTAMEQIVSDWIGKRLPKLKSKGWRLWARSRKNRDSKTQIDLFTRDLEKLEARIDGLRKEIAQEEWSKTSQVNKQCKILQPSIIDREDCKWKIATLKLPKAPEKMPPAIRQPRLAKSLEPEAVLEDGEEVLTGGTETSDSSEDGMADFIVQDEIDEDTYKPAIVDDDLTMADVEDGFDTDTFIADEPKPKTPIRQAKILSQHGFSPSNAIDLTQQSDPVEPEIRESKHEIKPERSYTIQTPPLFGSENDSEIFQRSRSKKPIFKVPPKVPTSPTKTTEIISLESDSNDSAGYKNADLSNHIPELDDVDGIRAMNANDLVERQDRKRLLIWTVAHTLPLDRRAVSVYLNNVSMEDSRAAVTSGLRHLLRHGQRMKKMDSADSDTIMRMVSWRVCWTIPVKVTSAGIQTTYVIATLDDDEGFEPFYDFLLECLQLYCSHLSQDTPKNKRKLIVREDFELEGLPDSQTRRRKYFVPESQETLDKRQAAQERLRANEERRRREELEHRFTKMITDKTDTSKVVVNPGKLADQDFVYLNPRFGNGARIKPHQEEGLQFLWREITSEHEDLQGCLLAQTMGLGKTMQVIALLVTLSEAARSSNKNLRDQVPPDLRESRTLILCPPALVENWWDECLLWPPQPLSANVGQLRKVTSAMKQADRLIEIHAWNKTGGILLLGFEAFRGLVHNRPRISAKTKEKKATLDDQQHEIVKKILLERPSLVVADEAHQFKAKSSSLNEAMSQIRTMSRIALTGSPLNNSLEEYHSLIDWIAPGYLGTSTEFKATYEEPIREGLYQDSTESQYRESRKRLKALELEMEPKVHRANVSCLHADLKGKSEFVIRVPLTELQRKLYCIYAENIRTASSDKEPNTARLWSWLNVLKLLCSHPKCYKAKIFEEESGTGSSKSAPQKTKPLTSVVEEVLIGSEDDVAISDEPVSRAARSQIKDESQVVFDSLTEPIDALSLSHKTQVLMNILSFSEDAHDKVLVFSHSLPTLDYIGEQLLKTGKEFIRIDGRVDTQKRQSVTKVFNEGNTNICLVSTRAGGQGLNLFGANRVVIMDEHFNPMWELQAIGRAYRIGQQKPVFVYRLTVAGTFEQAIQNQALFKEQLATRVVDKKNPNRSALKGAGQYLFLPKTVKQEDLSQFVGKDPLVLDRLLAAQTE